MEHDYYQELIVDKGRKDLEANLAYRVEIRDRAREDDDYRAAMIRACREDALFFFNAFCWLHEPRPMRDEKGRLLPEIIPFITWLHQDPVIRQIRERLGFGPIGIEKSRGEGASWIAIYLALQDWIFAIPGTRMVSIGIVSRNMEFADSPDDMSSIGAKVDWAIERLPVWMVGQPDERKRSITNHTWRNLRNKSVISAYAATGEVGSGGRYTYFIIDELAKFPPGDDRRAMTSTQPTTNSRLIISTPYGSEGAYHDIMHEPSSMLKLVLAWEDNPTRNRGLYRMVNGHPIAIDPINNPLPKNYNPPDEEILDLFSRLRRKGFRLEKGRRSPWFDRQCDEPEANPYTIAQEYGRDYGGSMYKIFTDEFFKEATAHIRPPFCKVHVDYDEQLKPMVSKADDGLLHLWMTLDVRNRPPKHPYVVAVDLSTGLGGTYTSNSVIEIIDTLTMEQVGELAANTIAPDDFADLSVAICHWLGGAYLAWERNGPGSGYTTRIKEIRYPDVYIRTKLFDRRRRKKTTEPGWWTDHKSKEVLFSDLKLTVAMGELKLHSDDLVKECHQYIRIGRSIEHAANARGDQGPDSGESHGDRVIAFGVGVQAVHDRPNQPSPTPDSQPGPSAERYGADAENPGLDDWDDRSNWDLMHGRSSGLIGRDFGFRW